MIGLCMYNDLDCVLRCSRNHPEMGTVTTYEIAGATHNLSLHTVAVCLPRQILDKQARSRLMALLFGLA